MAIGWSEVLIKAVFVDELTIGVPIMCVACVGTNLIIFCCPALLRRTKRNEQTQNISNNDIQIESESP